MKITKTQRREALAHPDRLIRDEILRITDRFQDSGHEVTRLIQRSIDHHGIEEGFSYPHRLTGFSLDDEAAAWVLQKLQSSSTAQPGNDWRWHYATWLQHQAPHAFIENEREAILNQLFAPGHYPDEEVEAKFDKSIHTRSLTPAQAHEQLVTHCSRLNADTNYAEANWQEAEHLVLRLKGGGDDIKKAVLTFLQNKAHRPDEENLKGTDWLYQAYLNAAGYLQIEELVPVLLDSLLLDWEGINEDTPTALACIGSADTIEQVTDFYRRHLTQNDARSGISHIPLFLTRFFEHIDSDLAAEKAAELLKEDDSFMNRCCLADAMASILDTRHTPAVLAFWRENREDGEARGLAGPLYALAILSGEEPEELPQWKEDLKGESKQLSGGINDLLKNFENLFQPKINLGSTPAQPKPPKPERERTYWQKPKVTTGRNDPCPCGSGKKFKKCCINSH